MEESGNVAWELWLCGEVVLYLGRCCVLEIVDWSMGSVEEEKKVGWSLLSDRKMTCEVFGLGGHGGGVCGVTCGDESSKMCRS